MGSLPLKGTYSASRVASIIGLSDYQTTLESFQTIMEENNPGWNKSKGYTLPEFQESAPLRWGLAFEPAMVKLAEEQFKTEITEQEKSYTKQFGDITLSAHIDGRIDGKTLLENKTTNERAYHSIKDEKLQWGSPETDAVPAAYQIQAAVQRICTNTELVHLNVLIFPKATDDFEKEGWEIEKVAPEHRTSYQSEYMMKKDGGFQLPICWARTFQEIGNFHTYNLPTNKKLESLIIEKVQEFDEKFVKTELPPEFENYADVRRTITAPMGTIIATDEILPVINNYMHLKDLLGSKSPHIKAKEHDKVKIMNWMNSMRKEEWNVPNDKVAIVDPNGGKALVTYSTKGGFRTASI